jgi:hypothetical protein
MMTDVLNLDELFGQKVALKVRFGGQEYGLLDPESLGPREMVRFQQLQAQVGQLQGAAEMTDEQAAALENLLDEMLRMLCPELPFGNPELTFVKKSRILAFYAERVQKKMSGQAPQE